jgi:hypothetical protein
MVREGCARAVMAGFEQAHVHTCNISSFSLAVVRFIPE